jgi:hypothetical protein
MSDTQTITPEDIEAKFTQLKDEIDGTTASSQQSLLRTGIIVAAVVMILIFLIGKRRGRADRTVVEIRRV